MASKTLLILRSCEAASRRTQDADPAKESETFAAALLPEMPLGEHVVEDYATLGLTIKRHPLAFLRAELAQRRPRHRRRSRRPCRSAGVSRSPGSSDPAAPGQRQRRRLRHARGRDRHRQSDRLARDARTLPPRRARRHPALLPRPPAARGKRHPHRRRGSAATGRRRLNTLRERTGDERPSPKPRCRALRPARPRRTRPRHPEPRFPLRVRRSRAASLATRPARPSSSCMDFVFTAPPAARRRRCGRRSATRTGSTRRRRTGASSPPPTLPAEARDRIAATARRLVEAVRRERLGKGGIDAFLHEYALSSPEGVALMCLAEALLRIPDAETVDRLIRDKIADADWEQPSRPFRLAVRQRLDLGA